MTSTIKTLREATAAIIKANPSLVTVYRSMRSPDGMGGETTTLPIPITPALLMRVAELSASENKKLTEGGEVSTHIVNLTATFDANIAADDLFVWHEKTFRVLFVRPMESEAMSYGKHGRAEEVAGGIA